MQPRERELGLRLDAVRAQDALVGRGRDRVLEQGALADAGLAAQEEDAARACARIVEEAPDPRAFLRPSAERAPGRVEANA